MTGWRDHVSARMHSAAPRPARIAPVKPPEHPDQVLADLFTGSFVVESIFQVPGLGTFVVNGAMNRDYTMVVGLVIVYAALLLMLNLIVDILYHFLDRRIKLHESPA